MESRAVCYTHFHRGPRGPAQWPLHPGLALWQVSGMESGGPGVLGSSPSCPRGCGRDTEHRNRPFAAVAGQGQDTEVKLQSPLASRCCSGKSDRHHVTLASLQHPSSFTLSQLFILIPKERETPVLGPCLKTPRAAAVRRHAGRQVVAVDTSAVDQGGYRLWQTPEASLVPHPDTLAGSYSAAGTFEKPPCDALCTAVP